MKVSYMIILALLLFSVQAQSETPAEKGLAIAREVKKRSSGFNNYTADTTMVLRNRQGQENHRAMRSRVLETPDDGDKSMTIFDSPGDVRGTALLTFSHRVGDDDQWLYLPALKRVKRISASNKSGSFMGSEFAFEDLGSREVEKYSYRYLKEEPVDSQTCFLIELIPNDSETGYSRILSWVDTLEYIAHKEQYYDKHGKLLKTLRFLEYQQYLGFLWRAHRLEMVNHQNGKETDLAFASFKFDIGLIDRDFTTTSLKRSK